MTKKWWIFLLRVIIFHRKSLYNSPSERRYRAKREKPVTKSRGSRYVQKTLSGRQYPQYCPTGRASYACISSRHFVPGYARFTRYCLPGIKMRAGFKPAHTMESFNYLIQTGNFSQLLGNPISFNVSNRLCCFSNFSKFFLNELPGLMMSTIYLIADNKANNLFLRILLIASRGINGQVVLYGNLI